MSTPRRPGRPKGIYWHHGRRHEFRMRLLRLRPADTIPWPDNNVPYRVADQLGIRIVTLKQNGTGYLVMRVKERKRGERLAEKVLTKKTACA